MSHTYANLLAHVVFSTRSRAALIGAELEPHLHAYLGGIVRELDACAMEIGGTCDHVHILMRVPAAAALSDILRVLKTNSSRWVHEPWPERRAFAWQAGYGAFSVSQSQVAEVRGYIRGQPEHHRHMTFQEEFITFLRKHGIDYDERYVWD
jgi:REP element-mobilizing transposase RayT